MVNFPPFVHPLRRLGTLLTGSRSGAPRSRAVPPGSLLATTRSPSSHPSSPNRPGWPGSHRPTPPAPSPPGGSMGSSRVHRSPYTPCLPQPAFLCPATCRQWVRGSSVCLRRLWHCPGRGTCVVSGSGDVYQCLRIRFRAGSKCARVRVGACVALCLDVQVRVCPCLSPCASVWLGPCDALRGQVRMCLALNDGACVWSGREA